MTNVYVIAEAGVNHNGDKDRAFQLVDTAADAGADAVKFQTFNAKRLAASSAPKAAYQSRTTDAAESQLEMLKKLELPEAWHSELQSYANKRGVEFISTAFDEASLSFLETLDLPFYKVPSGEITNGPLLWSFARTGKRLILSTGMATLSEVEQALAVIAYGYLSNAPPGSMVDVWKLYGTAEAQAALLENVTLLHCTSQYPTPMDEVNLLAMDTLGSAFGLPVGYSDHTEGVLVPVAATARGAVVIEKHFTMDRSLPGPDHAASLEPAELKVMVSYIRQVRSALGSAVKAPQSSEWNTREAARQSLMAANNIKVGQVLSASDISCARVGGKGISPMDYWDRLGSVALKSYKAGSALS